MKRNPWNWVLAAMTVYYALLIVGVALALGLAERTP